MNSKVLFLAYYFPPLGGAGSQRSLKFVKYLPEFGIKPIVLAGQNNGKDRWAPLDAGLGGEIDSSTVVRRVNLYERPFGGRIQRTAREWVGMKGQFGARWYRAVKSVGRELLTTHRPDVIFATMSPFETAAGATALSAEFQLPWVADFRDPWALDEWQVYPSRWHRLLKRKEMERSLQSASLIIMNTPEAAHRCRREFPSLKRIPIISLTNGYDATDFGCDFFPPLNDRFTIVHSGAMHTAAGMNQIRMNSAYRLLGRVAPGVKLLPRSHFYLMKALEEWLTSAPEIAGKIRVEFVGVATPQDKALVAASPAASLVNFTGYLDHVESVRRVRSADLLFLPMHGLPPGARATIVPGKLYEYIASGRPILATVPDGDAKDFLIEAGTARICGPSDVSGIRDALKAQYERWREGSPVPSLNAHFVLLFERRALASKLAASLSSFVAD